MLLDIDTILVEWAWRTDTGIPKISNPTHLKLLKQVLVELQYPKEFAKELITELETQQKKKTEADRYVHKGKGIFVLKGQENQEGAQKFIKDNQGNFKRISGKEATELETGKAKKEEPKLRTVNTATRDNRPNPGNVAQKSQTLSQQQQGGSQGTSTTNQLPPEEMPGKLSGMDDFGIEGEPGYKPPAGADNSKPESEMSEKELLQIDHDTTDSQLNMTKKQSKKQSSSTDTKDVGAGTAESRAGEAMVHKGIRLLKAGKSLNDIKETFQTLINKKDHILNTSTGKKWVNSALASLNAINDEIGIENVENVSWDTPQGRKALDIDSSLTTSSDMFVKTKSGKNVGISLKKDGNVFLHNGGWTTSSKQLLSDLKDDMSQADYDRLKDAMSIDAFEEDLSNRFKSISTDINTDTIKSSFDKLQKEPLDVRNKLFGGAKKDRYFEILSNPDRLMKNIQMDNMSKLDQKALSKLLQMYHPTEYNHLRESDNELTKRTFNAINDSPEAKSAMKKYIMDSMHIEDTLGLNDTFKEAGLDKFITVYGIEPDGAVLNENSLITLFGSDFKSTLDQVRKGSLDKKELDRIIKDSIEMDYDTGKILFKHESGKKYPLFYMTGRSRGIGASPTMEMAQTPLMAHALRAGTFNTEQWPDSILKRFKKDIVDINL